MNSRERVKAAINWEKPDRIPVHENFWTDTLTAWKKQGLPEEVGMYPPGSVEEYFNFDIASIFLDSSPRFDQRIVSRDGDYYTYDDRWGYTAVKPWQASGSIHYTKTVTESREAWETKVKPRMILETDGPARIDDRSYFEHFEEYPSWSVMKDRYDAMARRGRYVLAFNYGPWEAAWRHRDFTNVLMDIALEPDWFTDMIWTHHKLTIEILEKALSEGIKPDGYIMVDDLGSSNGPLISRDMFRDILKPVYDDMGKWLSSKGIDFWLHSCGNVNMFLDDYIDSGVKVLNPMQITAKMDALELADKYRGRLAFYGNIDAHILTGPWAPLQDALEARCRAFEGGGWICHTDHSIPPDMKYKDFKNMLDYVTNFWAGCNNEAF